MNLDKKSYTQSYQIIHFNFAYRHILIITIDSSSQLVQKYFGGHGLQWSDSYSLSQDVATDF